MARQRRGGFKPPELRGTLGTLLRTTLQQAGAVREALERGAREGRSRIDDFRADRRRQEALAELGELVLDLIRKGEIDLGELPEAKQLVRHLDEIDGDDRGDDEELDEVVRPSSRKRFDDRDDGTVSSSAPARPWAPRKPSAPQRVWRPQVEEEATPEEAPAPPPVQSRERPRLPNNPTRKGGIAFDDEDLAEYMHPDDVPPKPSSDGDA